MQAFQEHQVFFFNLFFLEDEKYERIQFSVYLFFFSVYSKTQNKIEIFLAYLYSFFFFTLKKGNDCVILAYDALIGAMQAGGQTHSVVCFFFQN